jgi:hypothetical protein
MAKETDMLPLDMIAEWRKGCSCAGPMHDELFKPKNPTSATECEACTVGLIDALEAALKEEAADTAYEQPTIWPFGQGALVTAISECTYHGVVLCVAAVPDGYREADGKTPADAWSKLQEIGGPSVMLHFPTVASVDRLITDLEEVKKRINECTEFPDTDLDTHNGTDNERS